MSIIIILLAFINYSNLKHFKSYLLPTVWLSLAYKWNKLSHHINGLAWQLFSFLWFDIWTVVGSKNSHTAPIVRLEIALHIYTHHYCGIIWFSKICSILSFIVENNFVFLNAKIFSFCLKSSICSVPSIYKKSNKFHFR